MFHDAYGQHVQFILTLLFWKHHQIQRAQSITIPTLISITTKRLTKEFMQMHIWSSGYNNYPYPHEYYHQNQTFVQGNYANTAAMSGYYPHYQYHNHTFGQGSYGGS